uniref:Uncharacterized protein n=1 Tax=Anopheles quadriannulatus TaxID=34691 RepID=A0A182XTF2_ANOQN
MHRNAISDAARVDPKFRYCFYSNSSIACAYCVLSVHRLESGQAVADRLFMTSAAQEKLSTW